MKRTAIQLMAFLVLAGPASAAQPKSYAIEADQALLTYQVTTGSRQLSFVSRSLRGGLRFLDSNRLELRLRVPTVSFSSGSGALDALLKPALNAARFPIVEFVGIASNVGPAEGTLRFEGASIAFGTSRPLTFPILILRDHGMLFIKASFTIDAPAGGMPELPSGTLDRRVAIGILARLQAESAGAPGVARACGPECGAGARP